MSVIQPISYGLVHQIGPGSGGKGYGSYTASNTETFRPYQQKAENPIGRGYSVNMITGRPTVYNPEYGKEDPIIALLKEILGKKDNVVQQVPVDAGFKTPVAVKISVDKEQESAIMESPSPAYMNINDTSAEDRGYLNNVIQQLSNIVNSGTAAVIAGSAFGANQMTEIGIPMTTSMAYDTIVRQIEIAFRDYLPEGTANAIIGPSRNIIDLITNMDRYREDMMRMGERTVSDYVYQPIQITANQGLGILIDQARTQLDYYGEVSPITIADIVDRIVNVQTMGAMTMQAIILTVIAVMNPGRFREGIRGIRNRANGGLRMNPPRRVLTNINRF